MKIWELFTRKYIVVASFMDFYGDIYALSVYLELSCYKCGRRYDKKLFLFNFTFF